MTLSDVVSPDDHSVPAPNTASWLTLTTCMPDYSAAQRLIVIAPVGNPAGTGLTATPWRDVQPVGRAWPDGVPGDVAGLGWLLPGLHRSDGVGGSGASPDDGETTVPNGTLARVGGKCSSAVVTIRGTRLPVAHQLLIGPVPGPGAMPGWVPDKSGGSMAGR